MRRLSYILWGLWFIGGIVLKILGLVSWWVATSAVWIPLGGAISFGAIIFITADIGTYLKRKKEEKIPNECGNCLFGRTADIINAGRGEGEERVQCIGEKLGGATRGVVCSYYQRQQN